MAAPSKAGPGGPGPFRARRPVEPVPATVIDTSRSLFGLAARDSELAEKVEDESTPIEGLAVDAHRLRFVAPGVVVEIVVVRLDATRMVVRITPPAPVRATVVTPRDEVHLASAVGLVVCEVRAGPTSVRLDLEGAECPRHVHTDWFIA